MEFWGVEEKKWVCGAYTMEVHRIKAQLVDRLIQMYSGPRDLSFLANDSFISAPILPFYDCVPSSTLWINFLNKLN